jgi:hypothetical protein
LFDREGRKEKGEERREKGDKWVIEKIEIGN